ncbi:hypothetical protein RCL1_004919 [Eukaryota sp. TZLM3-RCL]
MTFCHEALESCCVAQGVELEVKENDVCCALLTCDAYTIRPCQNDSIRASLVDQYYFVKARDREYNVLRCCGVHWTAQVVLEYYKSLFRVFFETFSESSPQGKVFLSCILVFFLPLIVICLVPFLPLFIIFNVFFLLKVTFVLVFRTIELFVCCQVFTVTKDQLQAWYCPGRAKFKITSTERRTVTGVTRYTERHLFGTSTNDVPFRNEYLTRKSERITEWSYSKLRSFLFLACCCCCEFTCPLEEEAVQHAKPAQKRATELVSVI